MIQKARADILKATGGAMSEQEFEDKIEEAFRQLGIEFKPVP
jgi:hypothetical protein